MPVLVPIQSRLLAFAIGDLDANGQYFDARQGSPGAPYRTSQVAAEQRSQRSPSATARPTGYGQRPFLSRPPSRPAPEDAPRPP